MTMNGERRKVARSTGGGGGGDGGKEIRWVVDHKALSSLALALARLRHAARLAPRVAVRTEL